MTAAIQDALAAFQNGQFERARELAERGLATAPDSALLKHLLGLIACQDGRFDSGIAWLRQAISDEPDNPQFRLMLVRALIDSGQPGDALAAAEPPAGTSPPELALWQARAEAAHRAGRLDLAGDAWQAICSAQPGAAMAWTNLGRTLLSQSRFAEAERAYRRALAVAPNLRPALYELGVTLERTNQFEDLGLLLDLALEAGVAKAEMADLWAVRELRSGRADAAQALVRDWSGDPVRLNRLRAKAADAAGDPAGAFAAATAMNRATPNFDAWREKAAAYRGELRGLAATITPEWASRLPRLEPVKQPRLAFLVGFPRSGTTLADTFLMGHPRCQVIEEQPFLYDAARRLGPLPSLDRAERAALANARRSYLGKLSGASDASFDGVVIDKFPLTMLAAPLVHCLFPGAPIIFVQRHPCDAVLSGFMQSFAPGLGFASFLDIRDAADFYDCAMRVWTASEDALPMRTHVLIYEDLVRDPEAALRPVTEFLEVDWDERMLDHQGAARNRGTLRNTSYDQIVEPLTAGASGRWKRYEKQLEPVLPLLMPWAARLGYTD
jgi:tetratricopeptide (TPR) repeat protein